MTPRPGANEWSHGARVAGPVALVVSMAATAAALPLSSVSLAGVELLLLLVAVTAFAAAMAMHRRRAFLTRKVVLACSVLLLAGAVVAPPQLSHDVWSYAMYGRIVARHHANPYVHPPAEYRSDPALRRVAPRWRETRSVYGPLFTGLSAAGMAVVGTSATGARLFFQLVAAAAVAAALILLYRRRADAAALAWVGLNPVVLAVVAGGHNDVLVGAAVLAGVLWAFDGRPVAAGAALGLGCLVKVSGVLPLVAVLAWLGVKHGRGALVRAGAVAGGLVAAGYAVAGGRAALEPLHTAAGLRSRGSFWVFPVGWVGRHVLAWGSRSAATITGMGALGAIVVVAAVLIAARLRDVDPALAAGGAALVYLLGGAYVLPWYSGWSVVVTAPAWRSRIAWVAELQAAALLLVSVDRTGVDPDGLHRLLSFVGTKVLPVAEGVVFVAVALVSARHVARWRRRADGVGPAVAV